MPTSLSAMLNSNPKAAKMSLGLCQPDFGRTHNIHGNPFTETHSRKSGWHSPKLILAALGFESSIAERLVGISDPRLANRSCSLGHSVGSCEIRGPYACKTTEILDEM